MKFFTILTEALEAPELPDEDKWGLNEVDFYLNRAQQWLAKARVTPNIRGKKRSIEHAHLAGADANTYAQSPIQREQVIELFRLIRQAKQELEDEGVRTGEARSELEDRLNDELSPPLSQ